MLRKMLEFWLRNYKRYVCFLLLGFVIAIILYSLTRSEHIIVRSTLMGLALSCGYCFSDLRESVFSNKTETILGCAIFILLFIIISFFTYILFGYSLGIIGQLSCFFTTLFFEWFRRANF